MTGFLRQLRHQLRDRLLLIWDRLLAHRSRLMNTFLPGPRAIRVESLPPYAPELNPVEPVWSYPKMNPLANLSAQDVIELAWLVEEAAQGM